MNIQFDTIDLIISLLIIGIAFFIYYSPEKKLIKKLRNPIQITKQNIKLSRYLLIFAIVFVIYNHSSDIYFYLNYTQELGLPFKIKFYPITYIILPLVFLIKSKKTLKELLKEKLI
ncbi:MAG: hypothetical protein WC679_09455 [Bacteroidales bacterium]|jgi:hypothetical protein